MSGLFPPILRLGNGVSSNWLSAVLGAAENTIYVAWELDVV